MISVDGFLSGIANKSGVPGIVVKTTSDGVEHWALRREGQDDIQLGPTFRAARSAIEAICREALRTTQEDRA